MSKLCPLAKFYMALAITLLACSVPSLFYVMYVYRPGREGLGKDVLLYIFLGLLALGLASMSAMIVHMLRHTKEG